MATFEMMYDEDDDVLEVTFATFDEHFARTIALNDNVVLQTDLALSRVWGINLYSYRALLQVGVVDLDGLKSAPPADRGRVLALISAPPAAHFLRIEDADQLRAEVLAPTLESLL